MKRSKRVDKSPFFKGGLFTVKDYRSDLGMLVLRVDHLNSERIKLKVEWINISQEPFSINAIQNVVVKSEHYNRYKLIKWEVQPKL